MRMGMDALVITYILFCRINRPQYRLHLILQTEHIWQAAEYDTSERPRNVASVRPPIVNSDDQDGADGRGGQ